MTMQISECCQGARTDTWNRMLVTMWQSVGWTYEHTEYSGLQPVKPQYMWLDRGRKLECHKPSSIEDA